MATRKGKRTKKEASDFQYFQTNSDKEEKPKDYRLDILDENGSPLYVEIGGKVYLKNSLPPAVQDKLSEHTAAGNTTKNYGSVIIQHIEEGDK